MAYMEENDEPVPERSYRTSPPKLSKTPSWIMLGFVLGAAFVYSVRSPQSEPPPRTELQVRLAQPSAPPPPQPRQLSTIEAVFDSWGEHAVWSDGVTEVGLWNSETKDYSDLYEVRRMGDALYFRSIPRLTRRVIRRGKDLPGSPLQFTETEEQYQEWRQYGRTERPPERVTPPSYSTGVPAPRPATPAPATAAPPAIERPAPLAPPAGADKK